MTMHTLTADDELFARQKLLRPGERRTDDSFPEETENSAYKGQIVFKSRGRILFLSVSDIRWIGAEENYLRISTGTETHLLRETMTSIERRLDPRLFLRIHRSSIVNLSYVREVRTGRHGDFMVHLVNGQKLAMSRSYHARMSDLLSQAKKNPQL